MKKNFLILLFLCILVQCHHVNAQIAGQPYAGVKFPKGVPVALEKVPKAVREVTEAKRGLTKYGKYYYYVTNGCGYFYLADGTVAKTIRQTEMMLGEENSADFDSLIPEKVKNKLMAELKKELTGKPTSMNGFNITVYNDMKTVYYEAYYVDAYRDTDFNNTKITGLNSLLLDKEGKILAKNVRKTTKIFNHYDAKGKLVATNNDRNLIPLKAFIKVFFADMKNQK